jgi:hypothetical protein
MSLALHISKLLMTLASGVVLVSGPIGTNYQIYVSFKIACVSKWGVLSDERRSFRSEYGQ